MAKKEEDKFEIEDIKDPLDETDKQEEVDIEDAVAEEDPKTENSEEEAKDETEEDSMEAEEPDQLEKADSVEESDGTEEDLVETPQDKKSKKKKDKKPFPWKTVAIIAVTFLVTAALIMGGFYWYKKYKAPKEETPTPTTTNNVEVNVTKPATTQKSVYVTAEPTLNLRKEPSSSATILAAIPFGTKLDILETQGTWYKTTYNSLTGWVDSTYTSSTNPLVYQNSDYKFQITFPSDWAGYKLFPITGETGATAAWYVGLPTTDTSYIASGVDKGYASMFALTVYTPAQWTAVQAEEGAAKPTLAVQNQQWVIAYSLPNGVMAKDLAKQAGQTKDVVKTIKFY